jgi:uncharacterized cupin superfamily protein
VTGLSPLFNIESSDDADFSEYVLEPEDILEGHPDPRVRWLSTGEDGAPIVGLLDAQPSRVRDAATTYEVSQLLTGDVRIVFDSGRIVDLVPGDVILIRKGDACVWEARTAFRKLFVLAAEEASPNERKE